MRRPTELPASIIEPATTSKTEPSRLPASLRDTAVTSATRRPAPDDNNTMAEEPPTKRKCLGVDCENEAGSLQCPKCLSLGIKDSFFCSQDCFKKSWVRCAGTLKSEIPAAAKSKLY